MNISQLRPASELAKQSGVKALVYGPPGTGKTPIVATAPRPVLCAIEPGLLSMRTATNIPVWEAFDEDPKKCMAKIDEFFDWAFRSPEAKQNFDTFCIDSVSQYAEIVLKNEEAGNKHGLKAYGEMARKVLGMMEAIYFSQGKNWYLIAKQSVEEIDGNNTKRPYFPGKELNTKIPHLYDEIFHIDMANVPGQARPVVAMRTKSTFGVVARDRSGKLAELEPPHLGQIFEKCTS